MILPVMFLVMMTTLYSVASFPPMNHHHKRGYLKPMSLTLHFTRQRSHWFNSKEWLDSNCRLSAIDSDGVLGSNDLIDGTLLAFTLALSYSYLNRDSSNIIFWGTSSEVETKDKFENILYKNQTEVDNNQLRSNETSLSRQTNGTIFGKDAWIEISRPENYVLLKTRKRESEFEGTSKESKWYLVGLLVLFVPLFSAEFFLALSRQFICGGDPFLQSDMAQYLCSAHR